MTGTIQPHSDSSSDSAGPNCSVLLVEDNPINQKVFTLMLSRFSIEPMIANTGREALQAVQSCRPFDIIFMDLHMPGMHGVETAQRLRQLLGDKTPPIVALTADAIMGREKAILENGLDGFLTKPVNVETLRECIREQTGIGL